MSGLPAANDAGDINLANALDLSESEEEEEMEDIINDFSRDSEVSQHQLLRVPFRSQTTVALAVGSRSRRRPATRATILLPVPHALPHLCLPLSIIDALRTRRNSH